MTSGEECGSCDLRCSVYHLDSVRLSAREHQQTPDGASSQSNGAFRRVCLRHNKPVILDLIEDPYDVAISGNVAPVKAGGFQSITVEDLKRWGHL